MKMLSQSSQHFHNPAVATNPAKNHLKAGASWRNRWPGGYPFPVFITSWLCVVGGCGFLNGGASMHPFHAKHFQEVRRCDSGNPRQEPEGVLSRMKKRHLRKKKSTRKGRKTTKARRKATPHPPNPALITPEAPPGGPGP